MWYRIWWAEEELATRYVLQVSSLLVPSYLTQGRDVSSTLMLSSWTHTGVFCSTYMSLFMSFSAAQILSITAVSAQDCFSCGTPPALAPTIDWSPDPASLDRSISSTGIWQLIMKALQVFIVAFFLPLQSFCVSFRRTCIPRSLFPGIKCLSIHFCWKDPSCWGVVMRGVKIMECTN